MTLSSRRRRLPETGRRGRRLDVPTRGRRHRRRRRGRVVAARGRRRRPGPRCSDRIGGWSPCTSSPDTGRASRRRRRSRTRRRRCPGHIQASETVVGVAEVDADVRGSRGASRSSCAGARRCLPTRRARARQGGRPRRTRLSCAFWRLAQPPSRRPDRLVDLDPRSGEAPRPARSTWLNHAERIPSCQ